MSWESVLVIEDDTALSRAIENILTSAGYKTSVANNCSDGLPLALRITPGLLILDMRLPDGTGWSLLQDIKLAMPSHSMRVLVMSSESVSRAEIRYHSADRFLSKPFEMGYFLDVVKELLPPEP